MANIAQNLLRCGRGFDQNYKHKLKNYKHDGCVKPTVKQSG